MTTRFTQVTLQCIRGRAHAYLRFGRCAHQVAIDAQHTVVSFVAGAIFCRVRWERITHNAMSWQASVLWAGADESGPGLIEGVHPGAVALLHVEGDHVHALLRLIDAMEAQGIDPCTVPADTWRNVGNIAATGCRSLHGRGR